MNEDWMNQAYPKESPVSAPSVTLGGYVARTFGWMFAGLLTTFLVAFSGYMTGWIALVTYIPGWIYLLLIAEVATVVFLSARVTKMGINTARALFFLYSALNGIVFSLYFLLFDLASMGFLIGQCIGRWGNFVNQEAFGTNTTLPWGMISENTTAYLSSVQATLAAQGITVDPNLPVHPTFLYESLWCLVGFLLLAAYEKHRRFHGEVMLMYVMWYGLGRFFIEGLRTDSLMVGPFRISQVVAAASTLAALALWLVLRKKYAGVPLMVTYTAVEKGKDGPVACSVSWPAGQTPSAAQLKEQLAAARARLQQAGAGETAPDEAGPAPAAPEEAPGQKAAQAEPEKSIVLEKEEKKIFQEVLSELLSG